MKVERNILIAFFLNLFFSIFEFIGGLFTNSISIISDSLHDFIDTISIGISFILEKLSNKKANKTHTYGYLRYSVLGALITTFMLIIGSILVIYNAIIRFINPVEINYNGMIMFAVVGVVVNFIAAKITSHGDSLNQKSVNLHMLEDVFNWLVVLLGSIIMKFTDISILDPIMCLGVAIFIIINAFINFKNVFDIFLEKVPKGIDIEKIKKEILKIDGVKDVHHMHIWTLDGYNNYATIHVVLDKNISNIKELIRHELHHNNINHVTIELENIDETCNDEICSMELKKHHYHNH